MAGVWAPWKNPKTEKWEDTFSIFTSDPNGVMVPIHDRQPVILDPHEFEEWLTPTERPYTSTSEPLAASTFLFLAGTE